MHLLVFAVASRLVAAGVSSAEYRTTFPPAFSPSLAGWERGARVGSNETVGVDLVLSLDRTMVSYAEQVLMEISDPESPRFGSHLTAEEVAEMLTPAKDHLHKVVGWLVRSGVPQSAIRSSTNGDHLSFNVTADQAKTLLQAEYRRFTNGGHSQAAFESYSLPASISSYVDYIAPTLHHGRQQVPDLPSPDHSEVNLNRASRDTEARAVRTINCFQYMTPHCLRAIYGIPENFTSPAHRNNSLGVYTPAWSTWLEDDMDAFFADFEPHLIGQRPIITSINGGYRQWDVQRPPFNLEANLDYQYTMSLAYPLPITDIQVGDKYLLGNLNTMLGAFDKHYCKTALDGNYDPVYPNPLPGGYDGIDCGTHTPPRVIAITYAWNEAFYSERYIERQCLEFLRLGLQGVTVLAASADRGPADQLGHCIDRETGDPNATEGRFASSFPSSCPWVTSVGATQLRPANGTWSEGAGFPAETALDSGFTSSGGGFSRFFPAPAYQADVTKEYLGNLEMKAHLSNLSSLGYFSPRGRGYPDLSGMGHGYLVNMYGAYQSVKGTSASTPLIASMIARVNDARLHAGKGTVGFLNPVLYAYRDEIMRDVSTGLNWGCGVDEAFLAGRGWDAVTGLGTPDFQKLVDLYRRLP